MTSIERTAFPQFRRLTSARVLHVFFTPAEDEVAWARERTESPEALLALLVDLKCFQKMARFCSREEIPQPVTDHVRHCLGLAPEVEPDHGAARTMRLHRGQVRKRQGVTRDPQRARALADAAIREAALVRNHPPDLINVALERIIEASLELPAYSTLDEMAATIRAEVNEAIFAGIVARMGLEGRQRAQGLLSTAGSDGRSMFNRLKKPAQRATWSRFKAQAEYLDEVDELGDTASWLEGVAPGKVADFAGEAAAQDVDTLSRYGDDKRLALVACLVHAARMRARDDLAEMLCKRRVHREEGQGRAGGDPAPAACGVGAADRHLPHRPGAPGPGRRDRQPGTRPGSGPRGGRGRGGRRVRRPAVRHRGGVGLPRRQLRGAGAPVLPQGPVGDVRAGGQAQPGRHLQRRLGAGRAAARPRIPCRAARPHPAAAARRRRGRRLGNRVRVGELAARGHRPPPPRHGGPAALRGDGVHLPGRGAPYRGHRDHRCRGVRRLAGEPAAVGGVRAAAGGVLRRGRAARHGGPGSPSGCGTPTWTRRPRWTPGTRTTPTW